MRQFLIELLCWLNGHHWNLEWKVQYFASVAHDVLAGIRCGKCGKFIKPPNEVMPTVFERDASLKIPERETALEWAHRMQQEFVRDA